MDEAGRIAITVLGSVIALLSGSGVLLWARKRWAEPSMPLRRASTTSLACLLRSAAAASAESDARSMRPVPRRRDSLL